MTKQSDSAIQTILIQKKASLETRIAELRLDDPFLDPDHVTDNAAVDTDVREQIGHDTIEASIASMQKQLDQVESALKRTFDNTYGACVNCGKMISQERLNLIPEAEHCIECHSKGFTSSL